MGFNKAFKELISFDLKSKQTSQSLTPTKIKLVLRDTKDQYKDKKEVKKRQIVNDQEKGVKQKPLDSKYLARVNNKVLRETKASKVDRFKKAGRGDRKALDKKTVSSSVNKSQKSSKVAKKIVKKSVRKNKLKPKKLKSLKDLAFQPSHPMPQAKPKAAPTPKSNPTQRQGLKNGIRSKSGLAQNNDFLEDVKMGDLTSLNTVEFKFYGYYHRIRQKLEQYWGASIQEKAEQLMKQGRSIASNSQKMTYLKITLDHLGKIRKIKLKSTSGIRELDDAAIESFNKAGPFPNPPKDILQNGTATIEWGFVVTT